MNFHDAFLLVMFRLGFGIIFLSQEQIAEAFALDFMRRYGEILEKFD